MPIIVLSSSRVLFCFLMILPPPRSTLFAYTTLFRSRAVRRSGGRVLANTHLRREEERYEVIAARGHAARHHDATGDRKSTRLNSSHRCISYAVSCLKKKKQTYNNRSNLRTTTNSETM